MKCLLVALNAKYIHSNPGLFSLKAYAEREMSRSGEREIEIEIAEYTINHKTDDILSGIFCAAPDVVGFSCYIWNISHIMQLVRDLGKVLPKADIWLGGPEASFRAAEILAGEPSVFGVMTGEGERPFAGVMGIYAAEGVTGRPELFSEVPGVAARMEDGKIKIIPQVDFIDMDDIPFPYEDMEGFEHRIVYYESSRGCPFSCSYCLSSLDKTVRFRDLSLVKEELHFFLERGTAQVKFVDRTFNCSHERTAAIWSYIAQHDNGVTNFHFEAAADLLTPGEIDLLNHMRPGLVQLEIGVQSANVRTLEEIRRKTDILKIKKAAAEIKTGGRVHCHMDLIAGLPMEDYNSFGRSFNEVYGMKPDQLQLGFLKVLRGSRMHKMAGEYGLLYKSQPPYEVLSTRWLPYKDVIRLKAVEEMVEVYYNSGQFTVTLKNLEAEFESPFRLFEELASFYEEKTLFGLSHSRIARYEILDAFLSERVADRRGLVADQKRMLMERYRDDLVCDLYLRENLKSRPPFARDQGKSRERVRLFFERDPGLLAAWKKRMVHLEVLYSGKAALFDYRCRSPLTNNAGLRLIDHL